MKEYNKEKLNEYAKELFALCLEKGFYLNYEMGIILFSSSSLKNTFACSLLENEYNKHSNPFWDNSTIILPIWELIEKVKAL